MSKISYKDKVRIETLWKLGFGYQTIVPKFPEKGWKLCSVKALCKWADEHGSATKWKPGSGWPKTARTEENVTYLKLMIGKNRTLTMMLHHFANIKLTRLYAALPCAALPRHDAALPPHRVSRAHTRVRTYHD